MGFCVTEWQFYIAHNEKPMESQQISYPYGLGATIRNKKKTVLQKLYRRGQMGGKKFYTIQRVCEVFAHNFSLCSIFQHIFLHVRLVVVVNNNSAHTYDVTKQYFFFTAFYFYQPASTHALHTTKLLLQSGDTKKKRK